MDTMAFADAEYWNNVCVVQLRRGLGFPSKPFPERRIMESVRRQHLEGNVPAQRFLLRFIDDAHAAASDFAQNTIVAQTLRLLVFQGESIGVAAVQISL